MSSSTQQEITVNENLRITTEFVWRRDSSSTGPRETGIRIGQGRGFIFVADQEVLALATALADLLEQRRAHG